MRRLLAIGTVVVGLLVSSVATGEEANEEDASFLFALAQLNRFQGLYDEALSKFESAVAADPADPFIRLEFGEFLFQIGRLDAAAEQVDLARESMPSNRDALRLSGRILLRLGERSEDAFPRAAEIFEQLRALDPLDIDVRVTLGRLYMNQSRPRAAAEALREAHDMRPEDRLIMSLLVESLSAQDPEPSVIDELRALVEADQAFLQSRLALARALSSGGEQAEVVKLLEAAPTSVRANVDYLRLLAFAYYRTGSLSRSLATTERWLERRPNDTMGQYLQSLTFAALGRDDEAEALLKVLLEKVPENEEVALTLAELIERQGRPAESAEVLTRLVESMEARGEQEASRRATALLIDLHARSGAWEQVVKVSDAFLAAAGSGAASGSVSLLRIRALRELQRFDEALAALKDLSSLDGLEDRVTGQRAETLFAAGREVEALEELEELSRSEDVERLMMAAEVLHNAELFSRAVPLLERARTIAPDNLEVLFWLGASFERAGLVDEAAACFRQLLDVEENFAPALNYLGYMWADRGQNLDEALALVQRAVALEPNNGAYLDSLGWAYFRIGRFAQAREPLERAVELVHRDPIVFEHLGDLYVAIGEAGEADRAYRRALELGAENPAELRKKLLELTNQ